jgi:transmembrane sensor
MTQNSPIDPQTLRYQEAADWLFRLQEDSLADEQIVQWVEWCCDHPENRQAFDHLMRVWKGMETRHGGPAHVAARVVEAATGSGTASQVRTEDLRLPELRSGRSQSAIKLLRQHRWGALAATLLLALGVGFVCQTWRVPSLPAVASFASSVGQLREASLPDGSHIDLGGRSEVAINFHGRQRQIDIRDGEAFFAVRHDVTRPFVVQAGPLQIVAVGTAFDVLRSGERVTVTVQEGVVEVTAGTSADVETVPKKLRLPRGSQGVFDAANPAQSVLRSVNPQSADAWRKGRFEYVNEPLSAVIANLNRYSAEPIEFQDDRLGQLLFTGTIELHSIDEWLQALPSVFPVKVEHRPDNQITIQPRTVLSP